jgi:hypothetical protein
MKKQGIALKIATTCCLGLLMTVGSVAGAQSCGSPSPTKTVNWPQFHLDI